MRKHLPRLTAAAFLLAASTANADPILFWVRLPAWVQYWL